MASASNFKVESGIQLLARLTRKPIIENFYPALFESGPKQCEVIELYSGNEITSLLVDITSTALLPLCLKGVEAGVLIFNCSGHLNYNNLISSLRNKLKSRLTQLASSTNHTTDESTEVVDKLLEKAVNNLFIVEIYDSCQFYTTIHNLENILMEHSNISLVVFDTITAFYWSEQPLKIMKMDTYLKKILHKIQRITKEHKVTIIYSRLDNFSSSKDIIESLEPCCEKPTLERINYRIHIINTDNNETYAVNIRTFKKKISKQFSIVEDWIKWDE